MIAAVAAQFVPIVGIKNHAGVWDFRDQVVMEVVWFVWVWYLPVHWKLI